MRFLNKFLSAFALAALLCAPSFAGTVTTNLPVNGSVMASPVHIHASYDKTAVYMKIWVDHQAISYSNSSNYIDYTMQMTNGSHLIEIQAVDPDTKVLTTSTTNIVVSPAIPIIDSTTLVAETSNNTSASQNFAGLTNGDPAPGHVSKLPLRNYLYPNAATKIYAHYMPWWGSSSHIDIGLNETDPAVVTKQVQDAVSRGIDGFLVDWYGPGNTGSNTATLNVKAAAEATAGFTFGIVEDSGSLNTSNPQAKLLSDLQYMNTAFFSSPHYLKMNSRPVVLFFLNKSLPIDFNYVQQHAAGNPMFIFRETGGFTATATSGSFNWVLANSPNDPGFAYMDAFYATANKYPAELAIASAYKGFNDSAASWGSNRVNPQGCGQTWLDTWEEVSKYYSTAKQLQALQIVTWNDYEEGTEFETGIDNCVTVNAASSSQIVSWAPYGYMNTIDHFDVYLSTDGQNLALIGSMSPTVSMIDFSKLPIPSGTYTVFVNAVGKPGFFNHMSSGVPLVK